MRRILFSETDFSALPNPPAGFKYIGFDGPNFTQKDDAGTATPTGGGGGVVDVTYSQLSEKVSMSQLTAGTYYNITDFRTCYDQPDYDENVNAITVGNYKVGSNNPLIVFATSTETISTDAYQPLYPNDTIKYDLSFTQSEITGGTAYGRITERIDEWGNRTDYDHRDIVFKRYTTYFYNIDSPLRGRVEVISGTGPTTATVTGTNTLFGDLSIGDVVYISEDGNDGHNYKISTIDSDTSMTIEGKSISTGSNLLIYLTSTQTDNDGTDLLRSYEYYHNNILDTSYRELTTFRSNNELVEQGKVKSINNYLGNYSNFYNTYISHSPFLLSNNVFGMYAYSNTIGVKSYNNSAGTWFSRNTIDKEFIGNRIYASFYENTIGRYFRDNKTMGSFYANNIGNYFQNSVTTSFNTNKIGEYFESNIMFNSFYQNEITNYFESNKIRSEFYENKISENFYQNNINCNFYQNIIDHKYQYNTIGDFGNVGGLYDFYRNKIGYNFSYNKTFGGNDADFRDNQIGNYFNENNVYGQFEKNVIGNDFNNNQSIGTRFNNNKIGNNFNTNYRIGIDFESNVIGDYFESNTIGNNFARNRIGDSFANNNFDCGLFDWSLLNNLNDREYDTFRSALSGNNIGDYVVGENLILKDTVNNVYYRVKFTQWTQGVNEYSRGGGFSYERTKVDPITGYDLEPTVYFTKTNYGSEVDIIVPGVLEITRGDTGNIYNAAVDESYGGNTPTGTQWNSRFLANDFGAFFKDNNIKNDFQSNNIFKDFEKNNIESSFIYNFIYNRFFENIEVGNHFQLNTIGIGLTANSSDFTRNKIENQFEKNSLPGYFGYNEVGNYFYSNDFVDGVSQNNIKNNFQYNDIDAFFEANEIGNYFEENAIGESFQNNNISDNFYSNVIAHNFAQNTIGNNFVFNNIESYFGYGSNESKGNKIGNNFQSNHVGEYCYDNNISDNFIGNTMSLNFQYNDVKTKLVYTDFTTYNGNILEFTTNFSGLLPNEVVGTTYSNVSGTYSYAGSTASIVVDAVFDIFVFNQETVMPTLVSPGKYYLPYINGDVGYTASTITISGTKIGGLDVTDNVNIYINEVSSPSVYAEYNTEIFKRAGGVNRLSYYDSSDILTITDIDK